MIDALWPGGPRFRDKSGVFRIGTDSVLLAYFAGASLLKKKNRAVDLGCGSGVLSILLAWDAPGLHVDGVEIQPDAALLARDNAVLSGVSDRIKVIEGDLRRHRELMQSGAYDFAVANPPYYVSGSGKRASNESLAAARSEELCTIDDICKAAGYLTRWGGSFMLVHKPERLADIFRAVNNAGFEPKRIRFVQHKHTSPPNLVLIESRRGGRPSLKIEAPLILANNDGTDSDEVNAIYRRNV
jgi:tRNA1Val (adenine37-N6)-methyltransferase